MLNALLGVAGLLQSGNQQRSANNLSNRDLALREDAYYNYQKPALELNSKISKMILDRVMAEIGNGTYDFSKIQKNLADDMAVIRAQSLKDIGAGLKIAGYRPGDSAAEDQIARGNREITKDFTSESRNLRFQLPLMEAQALGLAANPAAAAASQAGQFAAGLGNAYESAAARKADQAGNPAAFLQLIMPYLSKIGASGQPSSYNEPSNAMFSNLTPVTEAPSYLSQLGGSIQSMPIPFTYSAA